MDLSQRQNEIVNIVREKEPITSKEIAENIKDYFPDTKEEDLIQIVQRYKDIDSWYETTYISEEDFNHIEEIVKNAGQLDKNAPYNKLINNKYAQK